MKCKLFQRHVGNVEPREASAFPAPPAAFGGTGRGNVLVTINSSYHGNCKAKSSRGSPRTKGLGKDKLSVFLWGAEQELLGCPAPGCQCWPCSVAQPLLPDSWVSLWCLYLGCVLGSLGFLGHQSSDYFFFVCFGLCSDCCGHSCNSITPLS